MTLDFFLIGFIYDVLFSILYLIPVCSEGNIVDHISAKHKLIWCFLQCCMIGASTNLVSMQLIEGSKPQSNGLSSCVSRCSWLFSKSNDLSMSLTTLYTCSMIAFACEWKIVTCSWFGFNTIIVLDTHLLEFTFESAHTPIVKDNKLRLWVTCQPSVMKQILDGCCW
jgi:hypothetical protein